MGRHALLTGTLPSGCRPADFGECPPTLEKVTLVAEGLALEEAIRQGRAFNRRQIDTGHATGLWALVAFSLRPRGKGGAP